METLFYKMIYDKQLKRSMASLEILYRAKHNITIKELGQHLGVSRKTVLTTLEFTKTLLPKTISLSVEENNIELINNSTHAIETALIEVAQKTSSFQILEHAFLNKGLNIHELAEKLFISVSALSARIRHISAVLSVFNCSLSYYDLQFIGNEADIRYFGYTYFSEFQELYLSACKERLPCCVNIYTNMKRELEEHDSKLMNFCYQQVTKMLLVTRDRLSAGKTIQIADSFVKRIYNRPSYQYFRDVYKRELSHHLDEAIITEAEIVWAYVSSFKFIIYFSSDDRALYRDEEDVQDIKKKTTKFLNKMADTLNIHDADKDDFLLTHMAYLINKSLLTEISPIFQLGSSAVRDYIFNNSGNLYTAWYDSLSSVGEDELFPIHNIESMSTQLAMISSQFLYLQKAQATKVLYSFEGESGFAVYLETLAKTLLPKGVEGVFIYNEPITSTLIEQIQPDIIVYNYEPQEIITNCKALVMSFIPQIQEWTLLKELIINLNYNFS